MARLILLNGPPGSGKSTVAQVYVREHPLALNLDIDRVRALIGGWQEDADQAGTLARNIALAMARAHLSAHHDVIVAQYLGRVHFIEQLERLAVSIGAAFYEVVLLDDKQVARSRFLARSRQSSDPGHRAAMEMVERAGGEAYLDEMYERLVALLSSRPHAAIVATTEEDPEQTYQRVLQRLQ